MAKAKATNARKKTGRSSAHHNNIDNDEAVVAADDEAEAEGAAAASHSKKRKVDVSEPGGDNNSNNGGSNGAGRASAAERGSGVDREPQPPGDRERDGNARGRGDNNDGDRDRDRDHGNLSIKLPMRTNLFSDPETWWMVDLHADPVPEQGATPLVRRCIRELGWSEAEARSVLRAYRQFLRVKVAKQDWDAQLLSPSIAVDQMWHLHVLDTRNYAHDCRLLCGGHYIGHDPDGGLDVEARKNRLVATRQALVECYGEGGVVDTSPTGPWKEVFEGDAESDEEATTAQARGAGSDGTAGEWITLTIKDLNGRQNDFRVRATAPIRNVFREYERREGWDDFHFVFAGQQLGSNDTRAPSELGLVHESVIHAIMRCRGC